MYLWPLLIFRKLQPQPRALHPEPQTLSHGARARISSPEPQTLIPKPRALDPELQTSALMRELQAPSPDSEVIALDSEVIALDSDPLHPESDLRVCGGRRRRDWWLQRVTPSAVPDGPV